MLICSLYWFLRFFLFSDSLNCNFNSKLIDSVILILYLDLIKAMKNLHEFSFFFVLQKARLARIRIAKASSGAAFVSKKKAAEARLAAQESGLQLEEYCKEEDIFELQHHHLLRCLEKTTVTTLLSSNNCMSRFYAVTLVHQIALRSSKS